MRTIHRTAVLGALLVLSCSYVPSACCRRMRPDQQRGLATTVSQQRQYRQMQEAETHRKMLASAFDKHIIARSQAYVMQEEATQRLLHRCALFNIPPHQCHPQKTQGPHAPADSRQQQYYPTAVVQPTGYLMGGPDDMAPTAATTASSSSSSGSGMEEWQQALEPVDASLTQQGAPVDALDRVQYEHMSQLVQKAQQRCWLFALTMSVAQFVMLVLGVAIGVHLQDARLGRAWAAAGRYWDTAWGVQALPGHLLGGSTYEQRLAAN